MPRVGWLVLLAGCQTAFGVREVGKLADAPGECRSFSTLIDTCALPPPDMWSPQLAIGSDAEYSAATHRLDQAMTPYAIVATPGGAIDVLLAHTVSVAAGTTLVLSGPANGNAVAIVADGDIVIDGKVTVGYGGAGARGPVTCSSSGTVGSANIGGGGGGGGGGFGGAGGAGGTGNNGAEPSLGGTGGAALQLPAGLVGGCRGGAGGSGDTTMNGAGGLGGDAGGAVALISATRVTIAISGGVNASGAGGGAGHGANGGGGGGGAGGMVWLEADTLEMFGTVAANGGGGGEGAGGGTGNPGQSGGLGPGPALGGAGAAFNGGDGGNGGGLATPGGVPSTDLQMYGGGGGGGGVGFIVLIGRTARMITGLVSPPPVMP